MAVMLIRATADGWWTGALCALVLWLPVVATAEEEEQDQDRVHRLVQQGEIVPLEDIIRRLREREHGRVLEAELEQEGERYVYEIEWIDDAGAVSKRHFDAVNGQPFDERSAAGDTGSER